MNWREKWKASRKTIEQFREENKRHFGFLDCDFGFSRREVYFSPKDYGVRMGAHQMVYDREDLSISISFDGHDYRPYAKIRELPEGKWKSVFSLENAEEKKLNPYTVYHSRDQEFIEAIYHHYAVILRRFLSE